MPKGIFISYRHKDTQGEASRLADDLREALPGVQIFRDVETIAPGEDFIVALERALADCSVMLVLIGPIWLEARDAQGRRKIDDANDWTRLEVATGLKRNVRVIPVTCRDASLPATDELPDDIRDLRRRQAFQLDNDRWRYDFEQLVDKLAQSEGFKRSQKASAPAPVAPEPRRKSTKRWAMIAAGAFAVLGVIAAMMESDPDFTTNGTSKDGPIVPPPPPPIRDISGVWRSSDGEVYVFQQSGSNIAMTLQAQGVLRGQGSGTIDGNLLTLAVNLSAPTGAAVPIQCRMNGAPDGRSFTGICSGPAGQFPTQFFR
jgi:TIR domain